MTCIFPDHVFPGWITPSTLGSLRPVAAGYFLFAIALCVIFLLLVKKKKKQKKQLSPLAGKKGPGEIDFDAIVGSIEKLNGRRRSLLFAANSFKDLPVTVPVHTAIRMAQTHRCLLVDLDTKRNAIAQVFGLESQEVETHLKIRSFPCEFENLFIWPARNFQLLKQMNLKRLLENASAKYDYVLVYAPYLTTLPDRRQIASCCKHAIACKGPNDARLMPLLKVCGCKVIQEI